MSASYNSHARVFTVGLGGAAGDGIREAGLHFGELLKHQGYEICLTSYYPSLIRGGHNYSRLSFSREPVFADHRSIDLLVAVNAESVRFHAHELAPDAIVLVESAYLSDVKDVAPQAIAIPMKDIGAEKGGPKAAYPSAALGAFALALGVSEADLPGVLAAALSDLAGGKAINTTIAEEGYRRAREAGVPDRADMREGARVEHPGDLIEGNKAVGEGFLAAGLEYYIAYPMTPATSLLHHLAKRAMEGKLKTVHPEDEITVINMALGVAYAGKRVAIGTANGGFALMEEAFAFAGVAELPLAIMVSQRQGPATGVPTHTGQSDLRFIVHAGHGEFPRLVIAPGDPEEAFNAAAAALNLAWKYQIPAIVLLDKHLSETYRTIAVDPSKVAIERGKIGAGGADYQRYAFADDGISPMVVPGTPATCVKATSYEHDQFGIATDEPEKVKAMHDKRFAKLQGLASEFASHDTVKTYGDPASDTVVLFWGSTKGAVLEAAKGISRPVKFVQILWMTPFDTERVTRELAGAKRIILVEGNRTAQLAGLLREHTGIVVTDTILRYDSEAFEPEALMQDLNRLLA
ncbi:MAG TPA: 2-oxoacid:acceptor oxidoreductase subunit alpha [Candidatus Paceibacterota bacterium]|nr:2-oxoacid:acceptor oxidoreductase subunit alpha [Candidatus Paceibacterota bacterium]